MGVRVCASICVRSAARPRQVVVVVVECAAAAAAWRWRRRPRSTGSSRGWTVLLHVGAHIVL